MFSLLAIIFSWTTDAHAGLCKYFLQKAPPLSIELKLSETEHARYMRAFFDYNHELSFRHRYQTPEYNELRGHLRTILDRLIRSSQLEWASSYPVSLGFVIAKTGSPENHPDLSIHHGVIKMNSKLIEIAQSDGELAVVIGTALLSHTLRQEIRLDRHEQTLWGLLTGSFSDFDKEIDRTLPYLLQNADFDPWEIVKFYQKVSDYERAARMDDYLFELGM